MDDRLQTIHQIDNLAIARSVACDCNELSNHYKINKSDLTVIAQNIRSIHCNFDDLLINLSVLAFDVDVIILTECRLNPDKPIPKLNKYYAFATTRHLNQSDGVVVYIKETLKSKVTEIILTHASGLQIDIFDQTILGIYRSPSNTNADCFVNSLSLHLISLQSRKNITITGDININILPLENEQHYDIKNRATYLDMLSGYGILPGHTIPTRQLKCIDHFMSRINRAKHSAFIAVLNTTITDHLTTFLSISELKNRQVAPKTTTKIDFEKSFKYLQQRNLSKLLICNNPNFITDSLIQELADSIREGTSSVIIPKSKRIIKPWITNGVLRCIRNRNKLQRESRNDPCNEIKKITFLRYRNHCNNLIKKLKRKYEKDLIESSINNNKLLWKNIKNLTFTNKAKNTNIELSNLKSTPLDSANFINNYFADIGNQVARNVHSTLNENKLNEYLSSLRSQPQSFVLLDTDDEEINHIIMNLKSESAPGWDNISTKYLKHVKNEVIPLITHMANLCFKKGIFPNSLKKSVITPIYKSGDKNNISNYRPISVLPVLAKILEKLLNSRLLNYLADYKILSPHQFGFRRGISTEDAVTDITTLITKHLDKGTKCLSVFLDLKKAFDTVHVPTLLKKLEKNGIRNTQLSIFKDYLSNRMQKVKLENSLSDDVDVTCGVPQGSVLGPTLFLIYINDLCNMSLKHAKIFSYADDTAIVFTGTTWADAKVNAEEGMVHIASWLKYNLLTLNTTKTNYICFGIYDNSQPDYDLKLKIHECSNSDSRDCNCPIIDKVRSVKYLGVVLDQRLSWYPHIEHLLGRIRKFNWIFKTLRHIVPRRPFDAIGSSKNILNNIYISLVQSVITYCIPVWGGALKTRFLELERAQRTLLKIMYFKKRTFSTQSLHLLSNTLSIRKLYIIHLTLKKHTNLTYNPSARGKRRIGNVAFVPQVKTQFASTQFEKRSAYIYNKINKILNIYHKTSYECKTVLIKWIQTLDYDEVENIIQYVK